MCVPTWVYVHSVHARASGDQKTSDSLEVELKAHYVGAGNQTCVLWKAARAPHREAVSGGRGGGVLQFFSGKHSAASPVITAFVRLYTGYPHTPMETQTLDYVCGVW